jgi:ATP-binding cassette subfamily C (CFTR/MRP) protein 1
MLSRLIHLLDTIVGSRGISLSGGQKQRVGLARALYSKKQLMLIDDGFSGLDAATEETVFVNLFGKQGILRRAGITAILVTHAVARLPYADHIIALNADGRIAEQGAFSFLRSAGGYVEGLATKHKYESTSGRGEGVGELVVDTIASHPVAANQSKFTKAEEDNLSRQTGEWSTYKYYFGSIGWSRSLLSLISLVLSGTATKITELLITYWTDAISARGNEVNGLYLGLYGMLSAIGTVFWVVACYHFFLSLVPVSAEKLHARLLGTVMNAPLYFFTSTDTGVTTNR